MSAINTVRRGLAPVALAVAVACALGACKKEPAAADTAAPTAAQQAPAPTPESVVSASVNAMTADQLRSEASKAYSENRLYAPAGNNAMEYYLALRDKAPADAGASSALTDLMPMTVIATEQAIAREDFAEAKRLAALIEKADAKHPSLARLKSSIASSETAAAQRVEAQKLTVEQEAKRQEDVIKKREEDQKKQQEQQRLQVATPTPAPSSAAEQAAAAAEAQRQQAAAAEAERKRVAAAAEAQRQQAAAPAPAQPARASNELREISLPQPKYPIDAQRAGIAGTVQIEFTVATDGSVSDARVVSSEAPRRYARDFEREAVAAVKRWRFQPIGQVTTSRRTISFQQ
ncbi:energy transducer TonB [Thermomonas sp.]|uniref:energy transducer TonB n=1 Tax=Thermomonas sp. TaxID=1971895 RepID=UPI00248A3FE4|nr:energy transducer TonB [Thermomonas sp.]MDI1252272.1 energy transducer TonB [Thermomonas sp.]